MQFLNKTHTEIKKAGGAVAPNAGGTMKKSAEDFDQ
jgi:hypothetical protein